MIVKAFSIQLLCDFLLSIYCMVCLSKQLFLISSLVKNKLIILPQSTQATIHCESAKLLTRNKSTAKIHSWFVRKTMNLSQQYSSIGRENDCKSFFNSVPLRFSSLDSVYDLLVAAAVLNLATCPFTTLLNALIMIAVKTKRRLQTHPNILLACLALTDLMAGLVVQPLHTTMTISLLQGKDFHDFCYIELAFTFSFAIFSCATVFHLLLISGERYLAIKHTFTHATVVTRARLIISSALAWIAAILFFIVALYLAIVLDMGYIISISSIFLLQMFVYKEVRRHEKRILSEQVSAEAGAKFKQEKKALKLTTIILVTIFLCSFLPSIFVIVTWHIFSETFSPDVKTLVRHFCSELATINSAVNPVIYTVRKKEFRVAIIELLLRKSLQEAEEFNRKLFGSRNNSARQQNGQEGEEQEQNAEGKKCIPSRG